MNYINQNLHVQGITFATDDPKQLAAFYQQAFNIPVAEQVDKDHLVISLDNLYLSFDKADGKVKPGQGGAVIWFLVPNVEEAFTRLVALGAKVRSNVTHKPSNAQMEAVLYDPDGNMLGLIGPSPSVRKTT